MGIAFQLGRFALAALAAGTLAHAGSLYKSVDSQGRVTFSDAPVDGAVSVEHIATSESAKPEDGVPAIPYLALADSFDEAVAQANSKVDLAEHALALARNALLEDNLLSLFHVRLSRGDSQQLEFFKRDVVSARRNLMRVLKQRNALAPARPFA